ncbi:unnamed protein product [Fraxinus pennsylvanica]|uniref:Uncharacterized protein n=1 Tax=Fraxinus pennsylvanica TaxID=56036 RepID=A0AAD2A6T6_9LAMI|nr:unnamed protein product [Fraxinus pennsylvanica]
MPNPFVIPHLNPLYCTVSQSPYHTYAQFDSILPLIRISRSVKNPSLYRIICIRNHTVPNSITEVFQHGFQQKGKRLVEEEVPGHSTKKKKIVNKNLSQTRLQTIRDKVTGFYPGDMKISGGGDDMASMEENRLQVISKVPIGCLSLAVYLLHVHHPYDSRGDGQGLQRNSKSWNKASNLLFLESLAGVGRLYSNTSSDYTCDNVSTDSSLETMGARDLVT